MYYSTVGLLAIAILLIENQGILSNSKGAFDRSAWKVYRRFLYAVLAYDITDVLWGFLESKKLVLPLFADTTVYFVAMAAGVLFWAEFTVTYLEAEDGFGRFLVYGGRLLAGAITFLALINTFTPILFTVDADCVYLALPLRYGMLAVQILLLLLISAFALFNLHFHQTKRAERYHALCLFGLIMATFLSAQLWYPYLPLYAIAYLLGTCLLHTLVVNEEKEEIKLGLAEAKKIKELKDTIVSLLDNMPAMTYTKDAETGVYLACNQAFAEYAHKNRPSEVVGLNAEQLFGTKTAEQIARDDQLALSMDQPYIFFEDVLDAAGSQRQLQTTKLKYTNFAGRLCVLAMSQDVTDLVRIQHENATTKEAYEQARSTGVIYTHIAQALARGYEDLYYVNLDSEEFIRYRNDDESGKLTEAARGWHFFEACRLRLEQVVHSDDRAAVVKALERKTLVAALERDKSFAMTFRILTEDDSRYVTLRVSRMVDDDRFIVLGLSDVDKQMKQRRAALRAKEEKIAYARLNALTGDYLCIYVVEPESGIYREFSSTESYGSFGQAKEGADFFETVRKEIERFCHPDDLNRVLSAFSKERVMAEIERRGIFTISYRLYIEGVPTYVQLKAAMVEENEGNRLIVGLNDIDAQVRQEEDFVKTLAEARINANIDALTGVKNRHAYKEAEERLNAQLAEHRAAEFAIVLLDVNDLKKVNDIQGHKAGDQYLRDACHIICEIFKHSPVFRVGGDEFAVVAQGNDYARMDELIGQMDAHNEDAIRGGGIVIACGMARYEDDGRVAPVFERADGCMYENKSALKEKKQR